MTDAELKEIEARCNATEEGPWDWAFDDDVQGLLDSLADTNNTLFIVLNSQEEAIAIEVRYSSDASPTMARFIAHARTDIPALIAEVRRLRNE